MSNLCLKVKEIVTHRTIRRSWLRCLALLCCGAVVSACGSEGGVKEPTGAAPESTSSAVHLTAGEVQTIIAQAATHAQAVGLPVTIAVVDHEGTVLGQFRMTGASTTATVRGGGSGGLEGQAVPSELAAISKAGTAAFFSTQGNAFSTRSASFIVQQHFPPQVNPSPAGPLFGVQFSQLRCSDVSRTNHPANAANLPLGLSGDLGGLPLYKNGTAVGGIGVEGDGFYAADLDPSDFDQSSEEIIAAAGTFGFSAPRNIRGDKILIDGITIPFSNAESPANLNSVSYGSLAGTEIQAPTPSPPTGFTPTTIGGVNGTIDPAITIIPSPDPGGLTVPEVTQVLAQAAVQANRTRAAIRNPIGTPARVSITVVDTAGRILGIFRTTDAPLFGFDVSAQKARSANFFTRTDAAARLTSAGMGAYVTALANEGLTLNGSTAFSDRAIGFMSQPIYPPGASSSFVFGPLSKPLGQWSIFNTGLQFDALNIPNVLSATSPCSSVAGLQNGLQIFPGSVPLFRAGVHVGAIGVSGDGVDQDDIIAAMGSAGFEAPAGLRSDSRTVRGVRLPYVVFPRNPNLF
ncbi:MAG: heme-binding protein [Nitrospira sp.]|nr:heme-binding protein [Nitrospira sp.]